MRHLAEDRRIVLGMYAFCICATTCLLAVPVPLLAKSLGASDSAIGMMGTVTMGVYTLGAFASGRLADRWSHRGLLVLAFLLLTAGAALMPHMPDMVWLTVAYAVVVLGLAVFWPTLMTWMSAATPPAVLPGVMMIFNLGWCLGQFVGDYLGGEFYGWSRALPFTLAAWIPLGFAALTLLLPRAVWRKRAHTDVTTDTAKVRPPGADRFLWIAWSANLLGLALLSGLRTLFPPLAETLDITPRVIGLLLASTPALQTAVFILLGRWHGWQYRLWPIAVMQALGAGACVLAALAQSALVFGIAFVLLGMAIGMSYSASLFYSVHGQANPGRRAGLHEAIGGIGAIIGPLYFGLSSDAWTPRAPYWLSAAALAVLIGMHFVILVSWRDVKSEVRSQEAVIEQNLKG